MSYSKYNNIVRRISNIKVRQTSKGGSTMRYKDIFLQKEYRKVLVANVISRFGDSIDSIAFTWLVYQVTESAAWSAAMFAMNQLPGVLVQPFAGALVEGMNKKRVTVAADVIRGIVVAGLAILYFLGKVNPWVMVAFTLIISTVEAFCGPASMALIPRLIAPEYYEHATSLNSSICTVVQLIGLGAAGVVIGKLGIEGAIAIDAVTFFGSAFIRLTLRVKEEKQETKQFSFASYLEVLKGGVQYLKESSIVKNLCMMGVLANAVIVPINSLQSPIINEVMGQGAELMSAFGVALVAGMGAGSFAFPAISKKLSAGKKIVWGGVGIGICMASYSLGNICRGQVVAVYALTIIVSFLLGFFASVISATTSVALMKEVTQEYLARVGAIFGAAASAATPAASLLVGALVVPFSTSQILVVSGAVCVILFLGIAAAKVRFE